jgi:hypothetical protein
MADVKVTPHTHQAGDEYYVYKINSKDPQTAPLALQSAVCILCDEDSANPEKLPGDMPIWIETLQGRYELGWRNEAFKACYNCPDDNSSTWRLFHE